MNKEIELLYKTIEAKDKIINEQVLMISKLNDRLNKAIEYIQEDIKGNYFKRYDDEVYKMCDELLEILGDKENEYR